jgi:hypothetical protein
MQRISKIFLSFWTDVIRVVLVAVVFCLSACSATGHPVSSPITFSHEEGKVLPQVEGDGNGGDDM